MDGRRRARLNALSEASGPLVQKMYAEQAQTAQEGAEPEGESKDGSDDVVDAEFEEVKDNK